MCIAAHWDVIQAFLNLQGVITSSKNLHMFYVDFPDVFFLLFKYLKLVIFQAQI